MRKPRINPANNYGMTMYNTILDQHFNGGLLRPWADNIKEYYELEELARSKITPIAEVGGRKPAGLVAGAVRLASEEKKRPVPMEELSKQFRVTEVCIRSNKKYLKKITAQALQST